MVAVHSFLALLAGFATMILLVGAVRLLLRRIAPEWAEPAVHLGAAAAFVHLGSAFLAGAAGGYMTAWTEAANPLRDVLVLGIVVLVLGGLSTLQSRDRQPVGYSVALIAIVPLGVVAGGLVRLRVLGVF
ncbi:MAG: hypothetical protein WCC26_20300 [Terracidiphilus sp.]